ncbi:MAG: cysteine-rich CWC family protein [Bacteroidota bacterium]
MENRTESLCPNCGKTFRCDIASGETICWCFAYPKLLKIEGNDCLCPDCLRNAIAKETSSECR